MVFRKPNRSRTTEKSIGHSWFTYSDVSPNCICLTWALKNFDWQLLCATEFLWCSPICKSHCCTQSIQLFGAPHFGTTIVNTLENMCKLMPLPLIIVIFQKKIERFFFLINSSQKLLYAKNNLIPRDLFLAEVGIFFNENPGNFQLKDQRKIGDWSLLLSAKYFENTVFLSYWWY